MRKNKVLTRVIWILAFTLTLSLLISIVSSCAGDIVGPQIKDKEDPQKKEDGTGDDPSTGGAPIAMNDQIQLEMSGIAIVFHDA